ncbi:hypothetical protein CRUP_005280, partial [Coryphaenoides rupestris]
MRRSLPSSLRGNMAASLRLARRALPFGLTSVQVMRRAAPWSASGTTRVRPPARTFRGPAARLGVAPLKVEMPALSPTMVEGSIVKWLKKE